MTGQWLKACVAGSIGAAALAGCAGAGHYGPGELRAGATLEQVTRRLGEPTARYMLPEGGVRLEFARGPFGKHTYMVDLPDGKQMSRWQQVLTEPRFEQVQPGQTRDAVLRHLGRPSQRQSGGRQGGEVWSYRYDTPLICQWFQVSMSDEGRVSSTGYAPDPMCEVREVRE